MKIIKKGDCYIAEGGFEERTIPKAAGFWWHGGDCRPRCLACADGLPLRVWWTPDKTKAVRLIEYATPDAKAALDVTVKSVEESHAIDSDMPIPAPEGLTYMPFQRGGIAYALSRPNTLFGDEMGLGKTIQALGCINADKTARANGKT